MCMYTYRSTQLLYNSSLIVLVVSSDAVRDCNKNHSAFEVIPEISQITPTVEIALHQKYILDKFF